MMDILIIGAGVVGTVYGAQLATAGNTLAVLKHGARTAEIADRGLMARDVAEDQLTSAAVQVVSAIDTRTYDLVLVAVTREQLATACAPLSGLHGAPTILLLGNNPAGRGACPSAIRDRVRLGFPGIGGGLVKGVAEYVRIKPQPTALESLHDARLDELASQLTGRGFAVQRVDDMDGWLSYHAVLVSCICAALYRCGTDTQRLSRDRRTLRLMCRAVTQGFGALHGQGVTGLPRNLSVLHRRMLMPIAVAYWARTMRSPMGELWFGAHARHAIAEMRALGGDVMDRLGSADDVDALRVLLRPSSG